MTSYFSLVCAVMSGVGALFSVGIVYAQNQPFAFIRAQKIWVSNPRGKAVKVRSVTYQGPPAKVQRGIEKGYPVHDAVSTFSMTVNEVCYPASIEPICHNILFSEEAEYQIKMRRTLNGNVFDIKISGKRSLPQ